MSLDKKFEQLLTDFPKLYGIDCKVCEGELEFLAQVKEEDQQNFRYEYACNNCGLVHCYREMMEELKAKWPYNIILNWKR